MTDTANSAFRIPAERFNYLAERIGKLVRRRSRLLKSGALADSTPIALRQVGTEIALVCDCGVEEYAHKNMSHAFLPDFERVYFHVEITGPAPVLAGYEFVATLQHENAGTILRTVPGAEVVAGELDRFRNVKPHCEHCKVRRYRRDSFVVRNVETREVVQVGRNCLGRYIGGGASPESVGKLAELLISARALCDSDGYGDFGGGEMLASLPRFLMYVATSTRLDGWVSRTAARNYDKTATVDRVWRLMFPGKSSADRQRSREFRAEITGADRDLAIKAFVEFSAFVYSGDCMSDYEHNLRVSLASAFVTGRRAGIAGSLIAWYERRTGRAAERKARADAERAARATSEYVGTVKERSDYRLTVTRVIDCESDYGVSHGHFFTDERGNVFVWWTGSKRLETGLTYDVKGTVKKHDEYKGVKQTTLTRCKVAAPD